MSQASDEGDESNREGDVKLAVWAEATVGSRGRAGRPALTKDLNQIKKELLEFIDEASQRLHRANERQKLDAKTRWKEWTGLSDHQGCKRGHKWTKLEAGFATPGTWDE